jgi:hypothetical protein
VKQKRWSLQGSNSRPFTSMYAKRMWYHYTKAPWKFMKALIKNIVYEACWFGGGDPSSKGMQNKGSVMRLIYSIDRTPMLAEEWQGSMTIEILEF